MKKLIPYILAIVFLLQFSLLQSEQRHLDGPCYYKNHKLTVGPKGGCYYINKNGNKTYVDLGYCDY